jgi:riboflavin biosynthesis pyrimidine reductase
MRLLHTLLDRAAPRTPHGAGLPAVHELLPALRELYDGDLQFPAAPAGRPFVVANFVTTLDGAVSYKLPDKSSGDVISGSDVADRFIMGLLRASADAVLVGATTVHDTGPRARWLPQDTYPDAKELFRDYRLNALHTREYPLVAIVSGSGRLDLTRAVFQSAEARTIILTTAAGEQELARRGAAKLGSVEVKILAAEGIIAPAAILALLSSQFGVRRLLHEGGPTLLGGFLAVGALDELFLTLSPQIAGRTPNTIRPGLVEGVEFLPNAAPWFDLISLKQSGVNQNGAHLYLRYRRTSFPEDPPARVQSS